MYWIKDFIFFLNITTIFVVFLVFDTYEFQLSIDFNFFLPYVSYLIIFFFFFFIGLYYILGSFSFFNNILVFFTLVFNFYLSKIFLKVQYYQSIYKDFVYETFFFKIKKNYEENEYYNAFAYYMNQKYDSTFIITGDVKETIIRKSRSMSELFRNIDVYILQQQQKPVIVEESVWEKITSVCVSYPVTITLAVLVTCIGIGIAYTYYTGYLDVVSIKNGFANLFRDENLQQDVVNMKETLSEVQKQVTEHSSELGKIVQVQKHALAAIEGLEKKLDKTTGIFATAIRSSNKDIESLVKASEGLHKRMRKLEDLFVI